MLCVFGNSRLNKLLNLKKAEYDDTQNLHQYFVKIKKYVDIWYFSKNFKSIELFSLLVTIVVLTTLKKDPDLKCQRDARLGMRLAWK